MEILLSNIKKGKKSDYNCNSQEVLVIIKKPNQKSSQDIGENDIKSSGYRDNSVTLQQLQKIQTLVLASEGNVFMCIYPYHRNMSIHIIQNENKSLKILRNNIKHYKRIKMSQSQWQTQQYQHP